MSDKDQLLAQLTLARAKAEEAAQAAEQAAVDAYLATASLAEVGTAMGVSAEAARKVMRKHGVQMRARGRRAAE